MRFSAAIVLLTSAETAAFMLPGAVSFTPHKLKLKFTVTTTVELMASNPLKADELSVEVTLLVGDIELVNEPVPVMLDVIEDVNVDARVLAGGSESNALTVGELLQDMLAAAVPVLLKDDDEDMLALEDREALALAEPLISADIDPLKLRDSDGLELDDELGDSEPEALGVAVLMLPIAIVALGLDVSARLELAVPESEVDGVSVCDTLGEPEWLLLGVSVCDELEVPVRDELGVSV